MGRRESVAPGTEGAGNTNAPAQAGGESTQSNAVRQGLARMGTWGFGGNTGVKDAEDDNEDDDRRIRFTIGGAGRRLTKDDFLREIQSLDPKSRAEIVENSDASAAVKDMAWRDADEERPGSNRLMHAKVPQLASGKAVAKQIGAKMARQQGADIPHETEDESDDEHHQRSQAKGAVSAFQLSKKKDAPATSSVGNYGAKLTKTHSPSGDIPETAAERKRREQALKGVEDDEESEEEDNGRGRSRSGAATTSTDSGDEYEESAAERRRREAALGVGANARDDSDDDDTPRVPPPAVKPNRGIRFAQSPVRGKK